MSDFSRTNDFNTGLTSGFNKDNILRSNEPRINQEFRPIGSTGLGTTSFEKGGLINEGFRENPSSGFIEHPPKHLHHEHFPASDFRSNEITGTTGLSSGINRGIDLGTGLTAPSFGQSDFKSFKPTEFRSNEIIQPNVSQESHLHSNLHSHQPGIVHATIHEKQFINGEKVGENIEVIHKPLGSDEEEFGLET